MRYVRIHAADDGGSRFEDVEVIGTPTIVAEGVPSVAVSGPFPVTSLLFVEQRGDAADWHTHVAPRRQWVIVLSGRAAITTSNHERREVGPGDVTLAEDIIGLGHLVTPLTSDLRFAMIPVA